MDREYSFKIENEDYDLLQDFNKVLNLIDLGRTPRNHYSDASGKTTDGKMMNIEIKRRNQNLLPNLTISGETYTASTIYIETHKAGSLYLDYTTNNLIPIYINFLNDGVVVLYNLLRLSKRPETVVKKIYSKLYQSYELSKREELLLQDAWIYKKDENNEYKLIYKPNV